MFRSFTIVSILTILPGIHACKENGRSVNDRTKPAQGIPSGPLDDAQFALDGIAVSPSSMLISDNMAHYDELLEKRYPHLITMPVEQQIAGGSELDQTDVDNLKEHINQRLVNYYQPDLEGNIKSSAPILSFQVNTSGVHWETVIVDLNDLAKSPPSLNFEQWNFLDGPASLAPRKINQVRASLFDVLTELNGAALFQTMDVTETMKSEPNAEGLRIYLDNYFSHKSYVNVVLENGIFFTEFDGKKYPVYLEEGVDAIGNKSWQINHKTFTEIHRPQELQRLLTQFNAGKLTRPVVGATVSNHQFAQNLRQGANNCGVAAAWVTEQRASGLSQSDIMSAQPNGFHKYRRKMLSDLHSEFGDKNLPLTQDLAYPQSSYTAHVPKEVTQPKAKVSKKPEVSFKPEVTIKPEVSIKAPKTPTYRKSPAAFKAPQIEADMRASSFHKWWIGSIIAVTAVGAGVVINADNDEPSSAKKQTH